MLTDIEQEFEHARNNDNVWKWSWLL